MCLNAEHSDLAVGLLANCTDGRSLAKRLSFAELAFGWGIFPKENCTVEDG
jgi:hypothetical protein